MKKFYLAVLLIVFNLAIFGCTNAGSDSMKKEASTAEKDAMAKTDGAMATEDKPMSKDTQEEMSNEGYAGQILAGNEATQYLDFNQADYEKALKEKKKILLYFYANWCPLCRAEQPETFAAFNEIKDSDLTGFRINYRDSDTDSYEESLAKEFGVGYQHTKVLVKNGERVGKWPDSWDKQRYFDELNKA